MSNAPKTGHAYDGIEEYDNPLPGWWKWLFVASIVFAPFYLMYYHGGAPGRTLDDAYNVAMAANVQLQFAEIGELKADGETVVKFMPKENWVSFGKSVFKTHCVQCHGASGEGKVGPNLTDDVYKNVKTIDDIPMVIIKGAGNGAMPKWSNRLNENEIVMVSAYVATLRGKNIEGGRPAEGNPIPPWPEPPEESDEPGQTDSGDKTDQSSESEPETE